MSELKPCPFCGGEAAYSSERGQVICKEPTCRGWLQPNCWGYLSKQNAISHWNRRAERTCRNTSIEFECSECGASCAGHDGYYNPTIDPDEFKYCPNCGAKVVE